MSELIQALEARRKANRAVADVLKREYPADSPIRWKRGGRVQEGVVVHLCYDDRLKVHNTKTGKSLFICAYDVAAALSATVSS